MIHSASRSLTAVKDSKGNLPADRNDECSCRLDSDGNCRRRRNNAIVRQRCRHPSLFQRVYYDRTAEVVDIGGGTGNDTFIIDDSMAALVVSGDEGDDNFIIGRVIKTRTVDGERSGRSK